MPPTNVLLAVLSLTTMSASAFMGTSAPTSSHRLAFTSVPPPARPFRHVSLLTRTNMVVMDKATEVEEKYEVSSNSTAMSLAQAGGGADDECETPAEELSETQQLMAKVKDAGTAGVVSYALWELAFWCLSVPVCVFGYWEVTGHWPDLSNVEDQKQLGAEAFAFVNFARFAVPLRIGLALGTTPWIQENVMDRFFEKKEEDESISAAVDDSDVDFKEDYQKSLIPKRR